MSSGLAARESFSRWIRWVIDSVPLPELPLAVALPPPAADPPVLPDDVCPGSRSVSAAPSTTATTTTNAAIPTSVITRRRREVGGATGRTSTPSRSVRMTAAARAV